MKDPVRLSHNEEQYFVVSQLDDPTSQGRIWGVNTVFECVCGWVMYALCRHPLHRPARLPADETERLEALASLNLGAYTANDR